MAKTIEQRRAGDHGQYWALYQNDNRISDHFPDFWDAQFYCHRQHGVWPTTPGLEVWCTEDGRTHTAPID